MKSIIIQTPRSVVGDFRVPSCQMVLCTVHYILESNISALTDLCYPYRYISTLFALLWNSVHRQIHLIIIIHRCVWIYIAASRERISTRVRAVESLSRGSICENKNLRNTFLSSANRVQEAAPPEPFLFVFHFTSGVQLFLATWRKSRSR